MRFEWDRRKAAMNRRKHNVSFEEAETIFVLQQPVILEDLEHSRVEDRFYAIGFSKQGRPLTVCFVYRDEKIRIISARKATKGEMQTYAEEISKCG